jgi:TRAP-type mannitol/chloroaromatic compound transport system permease large subunit
MAALLGLLALFALLALGVPIGFAMALVGVAGFAAFSGWSPAWSMLAQTAMDTSLNYGFSVLPMFLLLGNIIARSNLADELYAAAHAFVRQRRGGLAHATILACATAMPIRWPLPPWPPAAAWAA